MSFTDVLTCFPDARQTLATLHKATCPACGGKQKLQITEGRVRAFVKCWRGCSERDIMEMAGLSTLNYSDTTTQAQHHGANGQQPTLDYPMGPFPRLLEARHRNELRTSGISDEIIEQMGVWSENDPAALRALGFSEGQSRCTPCMVFPCHTPDGRTFYQVKPDKPFRDDDGKPVKYMSAKGGGYGVSILTHRQADLTNVTVPLWVTEGAKKQGCAETHGLLCLGLSGVWMWQRKDKETGEHVPLKDWEHIPLEGRVVYVAFDSDAMRKSDVHQALQELITFLAGRSAIVRIVYLPDDDADGAKIGLDDYLAAGHTTNELMSLADDTLRPIPPDFTQEVVKALQKRTRDKSTEFSATGIQFSTLSPRIVQMAGRVTLSIESDMRAATFWIWADIYIATKEVAKPGELEVTFSRWFGQNKLRYAQNAATIAKKFPADKFNRLIPPWVFQEVANSDIDTQQTILDTYEADGMSRADVRAEVRRSKGLDPYPPPKPRSEPEQHGILPMLRELNELIPAQLMPRLLQYLKNKGTDEVETLVDRHENEQHLTSKVHAGVNSSISFWPISEEDLQCLPSGKYKGYALSEIDDDGYLYVLMEQVPVMLRPIIEGELQQRLQANLADYTASIAEPNAPKFTPYNRESPSIQAETRIAEDLPASPDVPLSLVTIEPLPPDVLPPDQPVAVVIQSRPLTDKHRALLELVRSQTTPTSYIDLAERCVSYPGIEDGCPGFLLDDLRLRGLVCYETVDRRKLYYATIAPNHILDSVHAYDPKRHHPEQQQVGVAATVGSG